MSHVLSGGQPGGRIGLAVVDASVQRSIAGRGNDSFAGSQEDQAAQGEEGEEQETAAGHGWGRLDYQGGLGPKTGYEI